MSPYVRSKMRPVDGAHGAVKCAASVAIPRMHKRPKPHAQNRAQARRRLQRPARPRCREAAGTRRPPHLRAGDITR
eukprot:11976559-Alexandrium_andersonii.AAC.1